MTNPYIEKVERLDTDTISRVLTRLDATQSAFLARMLTQVRAKVLQVTHARLNAFMVFPVIFLYFVRLAFTIT